MIVRWVAGRLIAAAATGFGVCLLAFLLFTLLPVGDPAALRAGRGATPEQVERVRADLGLDGSVLEQLAAHVRRLVLEGDLGRSYQRDGAPVGELLADRLPATLSLAAGTVVLIVVLAVGGGALAAARAGGHIDRGLRGASLLLLAAPVPVVGLLALELFDPTTGAWPVGLGGQGAYVPLLEDPVGWWSGLVLPWFALALIFGAVHLRMARASLLEALAAPHVLAGRARGLGERRLLLLHAAPLALPPVAALLALDAGVALGGLVVIEQLFAIPGLGSLAVEAAGTGDVPVLEAVLLVGTLAVVLSGLVADLVAVLLDPRLRSTSAGP